MASLQMQRSAFFEAIQQHDPERTAIVHSRSGRTFTYGSLLHHVAEAKERLLSVTGREQRDLVGERVAFLIENSYDYVVTLLACLACNAIAVPLAPSFPPSELRYQINHSGPLTLLFSARFSRLANEVLHDGIESPPILVELDKLTHAPEHRHSITLTGDSRSPEGGMMLYTSGTTARPKGAFLPTLVLTAQCNSLLEAWRYTPSDHLLHVLPLHHIHGTVNALLAPLLAGSTIEFMFPFNADYVWRRFAAPFLPSGPTLAAEQKVITFFTVVPTIWSRLLQAHSALPTDALEATKEAIKREHLRLNISGSAALPTPTKRAWTELSSGNVLLERYGMTEVGMALSGGLADEDRIDGSVGWPLPYVQARLIDPDTESIIKPGEDVDELGRERAGEIQLRGPTVFRGYWRNAAATAKDFTSDGWFKTGDIAVRRRVEGAGAGRSGDWARGPAWFILGRKSADIIKTGGEKVSALEIERELLSLNEVRECAVVGLPSETWGQKAAAVVVLSERGRTAGKGGTEWSSLDMRRALKDKLVAYKIPQDMVVVDMLPRNAMGKVNKKDLVKAVFGDAERIRRRSVNVREERERLKAEMSGQKQ